MEGFDVSPTIPFVVGDDIATCADAIRKQTALYIGGMGAREKNFYNDLACRMGYEAEATAVQEHYLARRYKEAEAALPLELLERIALLGPVDRIADRMRECSEAGVTTINLALYATPEAGSSALRAAVEALEKSGVGE